MRKLKLKKPLLTGEVARPQGVTERAKKKKVWMQIKFIEEIKEASHFGGGGHCAMHKSARPQGVTERAKID